MVEIFEMELAKARLRVNQAESELTRVERMLDKRYGVGIDITLCDTVRDAQRRIAEAREQLMKVQAGA
ncbi:hypothetical protein FJ941_27965 [Mesorhizobium sp. B2-3-13]|uniref:hypothetical protein n=1 Tax=Mesorhizobium sp. B2-3-13 TaxID=2589951 RepID=UPI001129C931|nr:hypothetical protein [Mesorhizobium sp. B2-3-13]TPL72705.1 hypothetical protein FJ941_27965 [Mesorhizobium sp. B2-3-13]